MLGAFGISDSRAQQSAICTLKDAGVISRRPNRENIAVCKEDKVRETLAERFVWHCGNGNCKRDADGLGCSLLLVDRQACQICGGSTDKQALENMLEAMRSAGLNNLLVIGGTEGKRHEMQDKWPVARNIRPYLRVIDSENARSDKYYREDRQWADVIVIWASTSIPHKITSHFPKSPNRITVPRRSISALAEGVTRYSKSHSKNKNI